MFTHFSFLFLTIIFGFASSSFAHHGGGSIGGFSVSDSSKSARAAGDSIESPVEFPIGEALNNKLMEDFHFMPSISIGEGNYYHLISQATQGEALDSKGYRVQESYKIEGGAGLAFMGSVIAIPGMEIGLGLMAIKGRSAFSDRFVENSEKALTLSRLSVPHDANEFAQWLPGDRLALTTEGGISVALAGPIGPIAPAVSYVVDGEWSLSLQKEKDAGWMMVELTHTKTKSVAASFGIGYSVLTPAMLSESWFNQLENETVMSFNLNDAHGLELFKKALAGDWLTAQNEAKSGSNSVRYSAEVGSQASGRWTNLRFSLPLIFSANASKGKASQYSESLNPQDGSRTQNWISGYFRERNVNGLLSKNLHRSLNYFGGYQIKTLANGEKEEGHSGVISFSYERNDIRSPRLDRVLSSLKLLTGMDEALDVNWDSRRLGYAHLAFSIQITDDVLHALFSIANVDAKFTRLQSLGDLLINDYMSALKKTGEDRYGICATDEDMNDCMAKLKASVSDSFETIRSELKAMMAEHQGDRSHFAAIFADMDQELLSSPLVFQSIAAILTEVKKPLPISLKIEGTDFDKVDRNIEWKSPASVLN